MNIQHHVDILSFTITAAIAAIATNIATAATARNPTPTVTVTFTPLLPLPLHPPLLSSLPSESHRWAASTPSPRALSC